MASGCRDRRYLAADPIPLAVRRVCLAEGSEQRLAIPVGWELDVYHAALHRAAGVCVYRFPFLHRANFDAWKVDVHSGARRLAGSNLFVVLSAWRVGLFGAFWRWHLEFFVQMGP